jgi:hypothetical protein
VEFSKWHLQVFGYLGQAERGTSDNQVVEDCLVSHFYPSSFLHSLTSFMGCFGHKTTYEWLGLYRTDFVFSVTEPKRAVITFSLGAVSVVGFGLKS